MEQQNNNEELDLVWLCRAVFEKMGNAGNGVEISTDVFCVLRGRKSSHCLLQ